MRKLNLMVYHISTPYFRRDGWILIMKMQSHGFERYQFQKKNRLRRATFLFLHSYYISFRKNRLQQACTQFLVIIVDTKTINVKTNLTILDEIKSIPFCTCLQLFMNFRWSFKFYRKFSW